MTLVLAESITIGRNADNNLSPKNYPALSSERVSGKHARLDVYTDGSMTLTDMSANGTYINGNRINKNEPTNVRLGDNVMFSDVKLLWNVIPRFAGATIVETPAARGQQSSSISQSSSNSPSKSSTFSGGNKKVIYGVAALATLILAILYFKSESVFSRLPFEAKVWLDERGVKVRFDKNQIVKKHEKAVVLLWHKWLYPITITNKLNQSKEPILYIAYNSATNKIYLSQNRADSYWNATGTGFFVSSRGDIMTNIHVLAGWELENPNINNEDKGRIQAVKSYLIEQGYVEAIYSIEIQPKTVSLSYALDGSSGKWEKCNLNFELPQDKAYDVAICRAESGTLPQGVDPSMIIDLKRAQTDSETLKNTMDILLIGYPGGYIGNSSPSTGKISVKSMSGEIDGKATDKYAFHHSANGLSGSSGSPVFNMYGKFIGVHHAGFGEGNNMCYAVPAKAAVELYERSK